MRTLVSILAVLAMSLLVMGAIPTDDNSDDNGNGPPNADNLGDHPAKYGLCTAYFAGRGGENGNKHDAPPFQALEDAADDNDESVEEFCEGTRPSNGQGNGNQDDSSAPDPTDGGQSDHNGRGAE